MSPARLRHTRLRLQGHRYCSQHLLRYTLSRGRLYLMLGLCSRLPRRLPRRQTRRGPCLHTKGRHMKSFTDIEQQAFSLSKFDPKAPPVLLTLFPSTQTNKRYKTTATQTLNQMFPFPFCDFKQILLPPRTYRDDQSPT